MDTLDFMHERDRRGFAMLKFAANEGQPCPKNETFCMELGFASTSGPVAMLARLERKGMIRVQRFQKSRMVEIIASGKKTAEPENTTPHWRARRKARVRPRELHL